MTTKLISREPTDVMLRAALDSDSGFKLSTPLEELYVNIFKAMFDAAVNPWQPIETAPKDGSVFLACVGNWMTVAHWHRSQQCLATNGPTYERYPADEMPTHWMPLPAPSNESIMPIPRPEE